MKAFEAELNSLASQNVWDTPRKPPPGRKVIPGRWVLSHKLDSMGAVVRYKARWVAKGFRQLDGVDYNE